MKDKIEIEVETKGLDDKTNQYIEMLKSELQKFNEEQEGD